MLAALRQKLIANWPLCLAIVFSAYSWWLLGSLYQSQQQIRQDAEQQNIAGAKEQAALYGVLLNDFRVHIRALAESPEIGNYLTNRNLGMSLRYGLNANIFDIQARLDRLAGQKSHRSSPLFLRLLYIDDRGQVVADTSRGSPNDTPAGDTSQQLSIDQTRQQIVIREPVRMRDQEGGSVIGIASLATLSDDSRSPRDGKQMMELLIDEHGTEISQGTLTQALSEATRNRLAKLPNSALQSVTLPDTGIEGTWMATQQRIPDSTLGIVQLFRPESIASQLISSGFLAGAAAIPLLVILFALMFQRMQRVGKALRYSRKRFETVFEHISDAILLLPLDSFRINEVNPRMLSMFGYRRDELATLGIADLSSVDDGFTAERWAEFQAKSLTDGMQFFPWLARDRNGRTFWLDVSMLRAPIDDGDLVLVLMHDISHSKKLEQELRDTLSYQQQLNKKLEEAQGQLLQSEKMASIGQLAAGIAHEINNPIGFIKANIGSLKSYVEDCFRLIDAYQRLTPADASEIHAIRAEMDYNFMREDYPGLIHDTIDGIERVRKIVLDMRNFSHIDSSEWEPADLHAGIESTLNVVWNELKYKTTVIREFGSLPRVECLPGQINQVIMNLLVNAAHAIPEKGEIHIRTGTEHDEVWIEIEDNGCGIPEENINRIFDPFFTTKPVGKGTGLGLSMVYGIVKKHNGRIDIDSKVGLGTRFRIHLPVKRAPTPTESQTNIQVQAA